MKRFYSLDYLRVIAVIMILYDHLGAFRNKEWGIKKGIDLLIATPLHIIQDFGAFGVSIFFLLSGFLFTWNAHYENLISKTTKRMIKIYLSSCIAFLTFWVLNVLCWNILHITTWWSQFSLREWLESITLIGYFTGTGDVINGTTWFLIPLFFFELISMLYVWLTKRFVWKGILITELILACFFYLLYLFQAEVAARLVFVYMPLCGAILGELYKDRNISFLQGSFLLTVNYIAMVSFFYCFQPGYMSESFYLVSMAYALLLLIFFLAMDRHFNQNRCIQYICEISLSVYLLQMTFGSFFMTILETLRIPFTVSFLITVFVVAAISCLHTKFIDKGILKVLR